MRECASHGVTVQLLLQCVQPHSTNITCARPLNVLKFLGLRFFLPRALTDVLFLLFVPSALRGVQHVTSARFNFARAFCRALVVFMKLEPVPWFWVRKIGWGPRGVASPVFDITVR